MKTKKKKKKIELINLINFQETRTLQHNDTYVSVTYLLNSNLDTTKRKGNQRQNRRETEQRLGSGVS